MDEKQVTRDDQAWRRDRDDFRRTMSDAARRSDDRPVDKALAERRRAAYLRLHDDDEAELELPR